MAAGTALGVTRYNGYTFDGACEAKASIEFVKDEAGRTVIYQRITITVSGYITGGTTDTDFLSLRNRLGKQGAALTFTGHGLGSDLIVNAGGGCKDVRWGPIPEVLEWEPAGANQAVHFVWRCTTHIACCGAGVSDPTSGILACNYAVNYNVNDRGYTTRTITGYLQIAQTRIPGTRNIPDTADSYRRRIDPGAPANFKRSWDWSVSTDKSRLDFKVVDTEIESRNAYPEGVVKINAGHRAFWSRAGGQSMILRNRLSMEIEMAAGYSPAAAWRIFGLLFNQRVQASRGFGTVEGIILESLDVEEEIFGTNHAFSVSWRLLGKLGGFSSPLAEFPANCGVWKPIDSTWQLWRFSLAKAFDHRGNAGLTLVPQNDTIIDLCGAGQSIPWNAENQQQRNEQGPTYQPLVNQCPPAGRSWLAYSNSFVSNRERPVVRQSVMQTPDTESGQYDPNDASGFQYPAKAGTDDTIQQGGRSRYYVTMVGHAHRVCYEVPRPRLQQIGGQTATEVQCVFSQEQGPNMLNLKTYKAFWAITYALPNSPGRLPPPINVEY